MVNEVSLWLNHCKIIAEKLKSNLAQGENEFKKIDFNYRDNLLVSEAGDDGQGKVDCRYIWTIYSSTFYSDRDFPNTFVNIVESLSGSNDLTCDSVNNIAIILLTSCLLNYKVSHLVFEELPDIALSLSLRQLDSILDDDGFLLERILLAHRLQPVFTVSRICSRLLRECKNNLELHKKLDSSIAFSRSLSFETLCQKLWMLSNLGDVIQLAELRNLIHYSNFRDEGNLSLNGGPYPSDPQFDVAKFRELRELSTRVLNGERLALPVPNYHINVSFVNVTLDRTLTPNLVQTDNHVSYIRETESCFRSQCLDEDEGYVKLDKSERHLSELLFSVDCSSAVIVTGQCRSFNIRTLAKRLGLKANKVFNVYTDESTDIKSLMGNWIFGDEMGQFKFTYGVLPRAMKEGRWLIFDSYLSESMLAFLVNSCRRGSLFINELNETVYAHENFQVFIIPFDDQRHKSSQGLLSGKSVLLESTVASDVPVVHFEKYYDEEVIKICTAVHPNEHVKGFVEQILNLNLQYPEELDVSLSKILKFLNRIDPCISHTKNIANKTFIGDSVKKLVLFDFYTVFAGSISSPTTRFEVASEFSKSLNAPIDSVSDLFTSFPLMEHVLPTIMGNGNEESNAVNKDSDYVNGSAVYSNKFPSQTRPSNSDVLHMNVFNKVRDFKGYNDSVLSMIFSSYLRNEPVILLGETGTGKTAIVQKFAEITGNTLKVFVFSENSDSTDLIGSYYPEENANSSVSVNYAGSDTCEPSTLSQIKPGVRFKFKEGILIDCIRNGHWLLLDEINLSQLDLLYKLYSLLRHVYDNKSSRNDRDGFESTMELYEYIDREVKIHPNFRLFACMNPPIIRNNKVIRLNSGKKELPQSFYKLFTAIYVDPIHDYDSLFNLASQYTRNVMKQLNVSDLCRFYLKLVELVDSCEVEDGSFKVPNFTLRNFVRALQYLVSVVTRKFKPLTKPEQFLYDAISANFLSTLGTSSLERVLQLLPPPIAKYSEFYEDVSNFVKDPKSEVLNLEFQNSTCNKYVNVCGYWIKKGENSSHSTTFTSEHTEYSRTPEQYVLCKNNLQYLIKLARIVSGSRVPVLLQGPTAAGKTSLVKYLCQITNHTCVRINNHEHTDISEYIGQFHFYRNKLVFEYGTLVIAMKYGYWVIMDELNLASSEILECLNRILDDNREIYISETNETIKCHDDFMIFATQNPSDSIYGGRKQLSSSFTNRFIQLFFDDIADDDLKVILHKRCLIPLSKSEMLVSLYHRLKSLTINSILFHKNHILVTTRDLIKLAYRIKQDFSKEHILVCYYSLVAEKLNNEREKELILRILNEYFFPQDHTKVGDGARVKSDRSSLVKSGYSEDSSREKRRKVTTFTVSDVESEYVEMMKRSDRINIDSLKRFFAENKYFWIDGYTDRIVYLVLSAVLNREHVLLVGETGIGKTTLVQLLSKFFNKHLNIFNCNQNTEASDFLGSISPSSHNTNAATSESNKECSHENANSESSSHSGSYVNIADAFRWVDGPLINSMIKGEWFMLDEISLAEDSVLEKINSILEFKSYIVLNQTFSTKPTNKPEEPKNEEAKPVTPTAKSRRSKKRADKSLQPQAKENGLETSVDDRIRVVYSHDNFRLFGTMNPGNDFGKKDLSPSLANRFTQIYVPSIPLNDVSVLERILKCHNATFELEEWFLKSMRDIVLSISGTKTVAQSSVTIRNLIVWSNYYFKTLSTSANDVHSQQDIVHFKVTVFVDGLYISILNSYSSKPIGVSLIYDTVSKYISFDVNRFVKHEDSVPSLLETVLMKCHENLDHISVLLDGNPGVGKTYSVYKVAEKLNKKLVRFNLSEYTDMSDLLGTYVPCYSTLDNGNCDDDPATSLSLRSTDQIETSFKWVNGPLLECMINGDWLLLDELNLASSEILEGLNSVLDHRRDIYISELNCRIECSPNFRIFATQNSVTATNYRKHLPRSFLNRFVRLAVPDMRYEDYFGILSCSYPDLVHLLPNYINFVLSSNNNSNFKSSMTLHSAADGVWNVRDLINIFNLIRLYGESSALPIVILNRLATVVSNLNTEDIKLLFTSIEASFNVKLESGYCRHFWNLVNSSNASVDSLSKTNQKLHISNNQVDILSYLDYINLYDQMIMVDDLKVPVLLVYNGSHFNMGSHVIQNFHRLLTISTADAKKLTKFKSLTLYNASDVSDLVGSYEQINSDYVLNQLLRLYQDLKDLLLNYTEWKNWYLSTVEVSKSDCTTVGHFEEFLNQLTSIIMDDSRLPSNFNELVLEMRSNISLCRFMTSNDPQLTHNKGVNFKWIDSEIVGSIESGDFLVINDVHLVSSSLLDRLNSLMEPTREMFVNECGYNRCVKAPEGFRIFFTAHEDHLNRLSAAFLNRCIRINLNSNIFLNQDESVLLLDLLGPLFVKNSSLSHSSLPSVAIFDVYNIVNVMDTIVPISSFRSSLERVAIAAIAIAVLNKLFGITRIFVEYFMRFLAHSVDLLHSFRNTCNIYFQTPHDSPSDFVSFGSSLFEHLASSFSSPEFMLFLDYIRFLKFDCSNKPLSGVSNDLHLFELYEKYYLESNIPTVWLIQKAIRMKSLSHIDSLDLDVPRLSLIKEFLSNCDKVDGTFLKLMSSIVLSNPVIDKLVDANRHLLFVRDPEFANALYYVKFIFSLDGRSEGRARNERNPISIDKRYLLYLELSPYGYKGGVKDMEKFKILNAYYVPREVASTQLISTDLVSTDNEELKHEQSLFDKFILKRVIFLVNRLFHDYLIGEKMNRLILDYFNQLHQMVLRYYTHASSFFKTSLFNIISHIGLYYSQPVVNELYNVLYQLYALYNHYYYNNTVFSFGDSIERYLEYMLFGRQYKSSSEDEKGYNLKANPPDQSEDDWELVYLLIMIDRTNSLNNLNENLKKMRLIEYLCRFSNSVCYHTFLFIQLLYNAPYVSYNLGVLGSGIDLTAFIKTIYTRISTPNVKSGTSSIDYDVNAIKALIEANYSETKNDFHRLLYNILYLLVTIYDASSLNGINVPRKLLFKLYDNTIHFSLYMFPHIFTYLSKLREAYQIRFKRYQVQEFRMAKSVFNILDSLSVGYPLQNEYLDRHIKDVSEFTSDSMDVEDPWMDRLALLIDFISEFEQFTCNYMHLSNPVNFEQLGKNPNLETDSIELISGNRMQILNGISNFVKHITTKYAAIFEVVAHPVLVLQSILFHFHMTNTASNTPPAHENLVRFERFVSIAPILNVKMKNPVLKSMIYYFKSDKFKFRNVLQLYLYHLHENRHNSRIFATDVYERTKVTFLSMVTNAVKAVVNVKTENTLNRVEYKLSMLQKQLVYSQEDVNVADLLGIKSETDPSLDHFIFENETIISTLVGLGSNSNSQFEHMRLQIMGTLYILFMLKHEPDYAYNDSIQSTFFYKFVEFYNLQHGVFSSDQTQTTHGHSSSKHASTIDTHDLKRVFELLTRLKFELCTLLIQYRDDPNIVDALSFVNNMMDYNISKLTGNFNLANFLQNLCSKLSNISAVIPSAHVIKELMAKVNELVCDLNKKRMNVLMRFNETVLETHKIAFFNHLFVDLIKILTNVLTLVVSDFNKAKTKLVDLEDELNVVKDQILAYLFHSNIVNMAILRSVLGVVSLLLPATEISAKLVEFFDYMLFFVRDYERVVQGYIEGLNVSYTESIKSHTTVKEVNCKKIIGKLKEELNVNFIHLYTTKVLTDTTSVVNSTPEFKSDLIALIQNNYEYILKNSMNMHIVQYNRTLSSIMDYIQNIKTFNVTLSPGKTSTVEGISECLVYSESLVPAGIYSPEGVPHQGYFFEYKEVMIMSVSYLFKSLNIIHAIQFITTNPECKNCYNIELFNKVVNSRMIKMAYTILNVVFEGIIKNYNDFNEYANKLASSRDETVSKRIPQNKFGDVLSQINSLVLTVKNYLACSNYSFHLESPDPSLNSSHMMEDKNNMLTLCSNLENYILNSLEYDHFLRKRGTKDAEVHVGFKWASVVMDYLSSIEMALQGLINNIFKNNANATIASIMFTLTNLMGKDTVFETSLDSGNDKWVVDRKLLEIDGISMMELCVFSYNFMMLMSIFLHVKPAVKEEEGDEKSEFLAGTGLDEGEGIKNVSKDVDEDELNLEDVTKREGVPEKPGEIDDGDNLDIDFDEQNDDMKLEDVKTEELEQKLDEEKIEDDYKKSDDHCGETNGEKEEVEVGADEYDTTATKDKRDLNHDQNDLEGFMDELDESNENDRHEKSESKEEDINDDDGMLDDFEKEFEEGNEDDLEEGGDSNKEVDNNALEEDKENNLDQQDSVEDEEPFNQSLSKTRPPNSDNLYGAQLKGYDNIIDELENFNLNLDPSSGIYEGEGKASQRVQHMGVNNNNDKAESVDKPEFKDELGLYDNLVKRDPLNEAADRSNLFEYYRTKADSGSLQGRGALNDAINKELQSMDNSDQMELDHEEGDNAAFSPNINDLNQVQTELEEDMSMDFETREDGATKEELDRIHIDNELLKVRGEDCKGEYLLKEEEFKSDSSLYELFATDDLTNLSNNLLNQLRMVLEYNKANGLKGYYKHGKRISIKKLMVFIATNYQKDKIWLKRLKPNKRDYFIQIAIDNTKSMSTISKISVQAILIIYEAIMKLNVGRLNIIKFGAYKPEVILNNMGFERDNTWMRRLSFTEESKDSYENGLIQLFQYIQSQADFITAKNKILIIISDGKFNKSKARKYLINIINNNVLPLLVVLDPLNNITTMKHITNKNGRMKIENYLDNFPFPYYSIISNIDNLPNILSDLLRQWMVIVNKN